MELKTRQFGKVEIDETKIITMPLGIPGFSDKKKYVLLQREETAPFYLFQCVDDPDLAFIIIEPTRFFPEYTIAEEQLNKFVSWNLSKEDFSCFVIVTIPKGNPEKMTANFIAPLIINNQLKEGIQLIFEDSSYSHQHMLLN